MYVYRIILKTFDYSSVIGGSFRVKSTKILRIGPGHLSDLAKN